MGTCECASRGTRSAASNRSPAEFAFKSASDKARNRPFQGWQLHGWDGLATKGPRRWSSRERAATGPRIFAELTDSIGGVVFAGLLSGGAALDTLARPRDGLSLTGGLAGRALRRDPIVHRRACSVQTLRAPAFRRRLEQLRLRAAADLVQMTARGVVRNALHGCIRTEANRRLGPHPALHARDGGVQRRSQRGATHQGGHVQVLQRLLKGFLRGCTLGWLVVCCRIGSGCCGTALAGCEQARSASNMPCKKFVHAPRIRELSRTFIMLADRCVCRCRAAHLCLEH